MAFMDRVPVYQLYGEHTQWPTPDMVHCESISDRSKLHNWRIKPHQHHGLVQLLYFQGGGAKAYLDDRHVELSPGQIVVVPPLCIHGFTFAPTAQGHVVTLASPLVDTLGRTLDDGAAVLAAPHVFSIGADDDGAYVDMAFARLAHEYRGNAPHRNRLMEAMLTAVLVWLSRNSPTVAREQSKALDRGRRHFRNFCQLIEADYARQLTVAQYAGRIGISAAHLNALCRRIVDQPALDLIHQRVVLAAKRNLVYTSMTISVVSYTLGFSDPAYFTRFFKRHVGMSPKAFRKQAATLLE